MSMYMKTRFKQLRTERGLSQQALADELHITQQAIAKYENGQSEPDIYTLKAMARMYHTTVDYLIGYPEEDDDVYDADRMTAEETHLLESYKRMDDKIRPHVMAIVDALTDAGIVRGKAKETRDTVR